MFYLKACLCVSEIFLVISWAGSVGSPKNIRLIPFPVIPRAIKKHKLINNFEKALTYLFIQFTSCTLMVVSKLPSFFIVKVTLYLDFSEVCK